ncbi:MAG: hypothetical protein PHW10_03510 [Candidatus Peribacteraceae bacterium]|nr:hypothetical protein [Candidatus Peribacteraceae bacterium]
MNKHNTHKLTFLHVVTALLLVSGTSMVTASTTLTLQAQVVGDKGQLLLVPGYLDGTNSTRTLRLHQAASPQTSAQKQTERTLFAGMLLILTGFLTYALHVEKLQKRETHIHNRLIEWFRAHLDRRPGLRHARR